MENKFIGWTVEPAVLHNSAISSADCYPLVQQIEPINSATANTAQQRMGDRISPKSLTVRGVVSLTNSINTPQNFYVRIVIAAQKSIKVGSQINAGTVDTSHLLRPGLAGVGTDTAPFTGNTIDLAFPVNRDLFKVYYDKIHKVTGEYVSPTSGQMPYYSFRWSYTFKDLPKALTFDEGNGNWCNNFAPFVALGYAYSDGTPPDVVSTRIVANTHSMLSFEDA